MDPRTVSGKIRNKKKINSEWVIEEKKNKLSKATVKIDFNLAPGLNSLGKGKIRIKRFLRIFNFWRFFSKKFYGFLTFFNRECN